ncbi:MAG TPA: outer membrane lipoprotein chaperone LolA [Pseudomonas sp.]|mgnify:FL=1|jgi:outer membrane lipoprotein carrier protein|uniref:outer membrane lipoprotein chaperone LolA n=1 Tax=Pseudomonas sp. TaxID=306 RepID=UPI002BA836FE|nr:outer membrane lipoprotein chaperone LolA [Pseudomonas sp.]HTO18955.1 outer membrane lipoprotein chaperone LolA [Pseudomonas sp.]
MNLLRLLILAVGLAVLPAQADNAAAVKRLTDLLGKSQTLSGRFSQLTLDASGTNLQESTGEMALKRPGQFRWHTDPPLEQLLVSDGKQVWLYDPDLEQVTIQKLDQRLTHTPALLLSGDVSRISDNFEVSYQETSGVADFILRPKARDSLFDNLRLSFRNGVINDMQLIDSVGQRTNILFSGVRVNPPLEQKLFSFQPPPGTDVIHD